MGERFELHLCDGDLYKVKQGISVTKINWYKIAKKKPSILDPDLIYSGVESSLWRF